MRGAFNRLHNALVLFAARESMVWRDAWLKAMNPNLRGLMLPLVPPRNSLLKFLTVCHTARPLSRVQQIGTSSCAIVLDALLDAEIANSR